MDKALLGAPNTSDTVTGGKTLELSEYDKVNITSIYSFFLELEFIHSFQYDFNFKIRLPHKAIVDGTTIKMSTRTLSTELCCPICLDLLTSTMTTKVREEFGNTNIVRKYVEFPTNMFGHPVDCLCHLIWNMVQFRDDNKGSMMRQK